MGTSYIRLGQVPFNQLREGDLVVLRGKMAYVHSVVPPVVVMAGSNAVIRDLTPKELESMESHRKTTDDTNPVVDELVDQIEEAAQAYYSGEPIISDQEFDGLVEALQHAAPNHPLLTQPGYGYRPNSHLTEVKHQFTVKGLPKIKQQDFLKNKVLPFSGPFVASLKLDGGSAVAYYKDGKLVNVVSRGDGDIGLDITKNVIVGDSVPLEVPSWRTIAVRGEVIVTIPSFQILGGSDPRNVAVGLSQSVHKTNEELKHLLFVAYDIPLSLNIELTRTVSDKVQDLEFLRKIGFNTVPNIEYLNNQQFKHDIKRGMISFNDTSLFDTDICNASQLPIDGLVLTCSASQEIGTDSVEYPSIAFKFDDEARETVVKHINWTASRTGRIVPVATVQPITLAGATIRRVTMNNYSFLKTTKAGVGSTIKIVRSNRVIPRWVETVVDAPIEPPTKCPACNAVLELSNRDLVCHSAECIAKNVGGRTALWNMVKPDNIGPAILEQLENEYQLFSFQEIKVWADEMRCDMLETVFGPSTQSLVQEMAVSLTKFKPTFGQVLAIANIPQVGKKVQQALDTEAAFAYLTDLPTQPDPSWANLMNKTAWANLAGSWYKVLNVLRVFDLSCPVAVRAVQVRVCLTGALSKSRPALLAEWAAKGVIEASVGSCDVLVADGPSNSAKYTKAMQRGIPVLTEAEFVAKYSL